MARRRNYPGSIERRGDSFRVRLCVGGQRYRFNLPHVTEKQAQRFASEKQRELEARAGRKALGLPDVIAFSGLLSRYEAEELPELAPGAQAAYQDSLKPFRAYFVEKLEDPLIENIAAAHVKQYMSWRRTHGPDGKRKKPLSGRTVAKDRAVLHRIFAYADELELREGNPVSRVKPPKSDPRDPVILSADEYERLLAACGHSDMLYLYTLFLGETGARNESEALWVRWEDLDLGAGFVWIDSGRKGRRTKSGKGRWVPLTPRLSDALSEHRARYRLITYGGQRSRWVFHHTRRRRNSTPGERIGSLRRAFHNAGERAQLPEGFRGHDLRHRRVTTWLAAGKDVTKIKEIVGHSDIRTTMAYTHLVREDLLDVVDEGPRDAQTRKGSEAS
jgi:integrase/recombinase XerD